MRLAPAPVPPRNKKERGTTDRSSGRATAAHTGPCLEVATTAQPQAHNIIKRYGLGPAENCTEAVPISSLFRVPDERVVIAAILIIQF
jgi:hypothetical protein